MKDISTSDIIVYAFASVEELYDWMLKYSQQVSYFFTPVQLGNPDKYTNLKNTNKLLYIDVVYTLLCFGWVDGWVKKINGVVCSRCSPRVKNSPWTEQNKIRCELLIKKKKMQPAGLKAYQEGQLNNPFIINPLVSEAINADEKIKQNFYSFPKEYQRIRIYNMQRGMEKDMDAFYKRLEIFKQKTKKGIMYGTWDDYGRLLED